MRPPSVLDYVLVRASGACVASDRAIRHQRSYTISPDGHIQADNTFTLDKAIPDLPRLGVALTLKPGFIAYFIILTTAVTLRVHGKTNIDTAAQAAEALRPIAGVFASLLFSLGVIGTGLLALPVMGGSAAYAAGEALRWPVGA